MTHIEQHKMILELRDYARKMGRYEQEDFEMMVKRDKDDEDLDDTREHLVPNVKSYVFQHLLWVFHAPLCNEPDDAEGRANVE